MFTQFRNWGIKAKIMLILLVSVFTFTIAGETVVVPLMLRSFMSERQVDAQQVVEVAFGILKEYARRVDTGQVPLEKAKVDVISLIRTLRFRGQEYFWIHDLSRPIPKMIMHPTVPALDGKVLDDPKFDRASGKRSLSDKRMEKLANRNLFVSMNEVVENAGEGFVTYAWPKPKGNGSVTADSYPKISFVKKFEPWGWVVGSGVYVDDVNAAVTNIKHLIRYGAIVFCLATTFIYYLLVLYISRPVSSLALFAKKIAAGEYGAQLPKAANDEVGLLSESLNRMSHQIQQKTLDLETTNRELQQELTEHRRAEVRLKASEEKFRTLVENTFDVIFVLDADGVFHFVSPSWETHFGYPATTVIGKNFLPFVHPDDAPLYLDYLNQVMTSGQATTCLRYRARHADDSWRFFIANGTLYRGPGGQAFYLGIGHDISEEKRLEEERLNLERQFLHAQKLESLGIMAGGIAHDFNNLLTVIIGNIELSSMLLGKGSPPAIRMEQAMQASLRAADLTRQMLAYSGKGVFELKQLDLNRLVKDNCELFRTTIPKTVSITMELSTSLPPIVGDVGQLQQVIMNLITNAAEAIGGEPGSIVIATGVQECDKKLLQQSRLGEKAEPGCYISIDVTDSGCGMNEEMQQRIFEPFYTTKFTGRGLGMSSVMGIIKSHNGAILLQSNPGSGSTFKILLPVFTGQSGTSPPHPAERIAPKHHHATTGTVLIVDDEDLVRDVCCAYLNDMKLLTLSAADGREAIDTFSRHMHDISFVILDLTMPHMDGVATLRELRLLQPDVKVIISSGHSTETTAEKFSADKPDGFIQKPFQMQELQKNISKILPEISGNNNSSC